MSLLIVTYEPHNMIMYITTIEKNTMEIEWSTL